MAALWTFFASTNQKKSLQNDPEYLNLKDRVSDLEKELTEIKASEHLRINTLQRIKHETTQDLENNQDLSPSFTGKNTDAPTIGSLAKQVGEIRTLLQEQGVFPPDKSTLEAWTKTALDSSMNSRDRLAALRRLRSEDSRNHEVVLAMVELYKEEPSSRIRADIFRQLNGVTAPELLLPLVDAVADETEPAVREEAAETLAHYLPNPQVTEWLEYLREHDPDEDVREQARESLEDSSEN